MKRKKLNPDDLVTEHIAVTQEVFTLLWQLKISWRCKRLNDVISDLIQGIHPRNTKGKACRYGDEGDDSL